MQLFNINSKISNFEVVNNTTAKVSINIFYAGKNRNNSYIGREAIDEALSTLYGCPIVMELNNIDSDGTFKGSHGGVTEIVDGELVYKETTKAIGFVDKSKELANVRWETIDGKEYLTCDAYLFTRRYPELIEIFENQNISQSMEILVDKGEQKNSYYRIYEFDFIGLCLLGEGVTPCFEDSKAVKYSFSEELENLVSETKESLVKDTQKTYQEEVKRMEMSYKEKFIILMTALMESEMIETEDYKYPRYELCDFNEEYVYFEDYMEWKNYKMPYTMTEDNIINFNIEMKSMVARVPKFVDVNLEEMTEDMEMNEMRMELKKKPFEIMKEGFNLKIEELKENSAIKEEKYEILGQELKVSEEEKFELTESMKALKEEIEALMPFKLEKEARDKEEKIEAIFSDVLVDKKLSNEEKEDFRNRVDEFENLEELANELTKFAIEKVKNELAEIEEAEEEKKLEDPKMEDMNVFSIEGEKEVKKGLERKYERLLK